MGKNNVRLTLDFVKAQFEEAGCTLLSKTYVNARTPLSYICECGTESKSRYDNFRQGKRCENCRQRKSSEKRRHSYSFIKEEFKNGGCELLSKEYKNGKTPLAYVCECGEESTITYSSFKIGCRCEACRIIKISGVNSPHYKPHLTEEHREIGRNDVKLRSWRKEIFERDDYTCYKCDVRGGELNAHHINAYNVFPELRYAISNGVTLCASCHISFHKDYGFGYNTIEQFAEWTGEADAADFNF